MIEKNQLQETVKKELKELQELEKKLKKRLQKSPEGNLHIMKKKKSIQYYHYKNGKRKYIPKAKRKIAQDLQQKAHDEETLHIVQNRIKNILLLMDSYAEPIYNVFENLVPERKCLISPLYETDEEFIERWRSMHPGQQNGYEYDKVLFTDNDEPVRSKSEKMIADLFNKYNIPYIYEPRLTLTNGKIIFPDFFVLNVRTRTMYIFEHFGMMGDETYSGKNINKINEYVKNGYHIGGRLLCSFENDSNLVDLKMVECLIKTYLL